MKTPQFSYIERREIVMPNHINPNNVVFGGIIVSWIDLAAAMSASKHSASQVVTVHIDDINFISPIKLGDHVLIKTCIEYVGTSSMYIGATVFCENPFTGESRLATHATLVFVAIDDKGNKITVPRLNLETEIEKNKYENYRKIHLKKMESIKKIKI